MLMVTVPPKTKRRNLSGTNSFQCHFIFHSSGSLETGLCNGGVGDPPHHNTMLFMFNAFHVQIDDEDADGDSAAENEAEESVRYKFLPMSFYLSFIRQFGNPTV